MFKIVVGIVLIVFSVFLIVAVMLQEGKMKGLGGAISGGSSDTYFGKNKSVTRQRFLSKLTLIVAILFTAIVVALYVGQHADKTYAQGFEDGFAQLEEKLNAQEETTAADTEEDTQADQTEQSSEEQTSVTQESDAGQADSE